MGYGKPPVASRFCKGQSGNPAGRPRGSGTRKASPLPSPQEERLKAIVLAEAYRTIQVNDASGPISMPMAQAVIRSLAVNAAKGHHRAQRQFAELLATTEGERRRRHEEWLGVALTYKLEWEQELDRRARLGIGGPEPLPHPDHVRIDMYAGTARIVGPATKQEKAKWDLWQAQKPLLERELRGYERRLRRPDCPDRRAVEREADRTRRALAWLDDGSVG
ncbi:DUF5681 domain-containing protein [Methylobacterium sp. J-076]|uniref:DUF5681 domain-containing protein n=1 Tax=Methylobacterium sp. J-076 TaxID=2836655 RepID=UPI001FB9A2F5|nr:DUF5681 domain-containing protein [Methylobacterium sp. J-076]MCJ2012737.1 DUF5681 domain-containing protein [Methylobacterium sp. J-076]